MKKLTIGIATLLLAGATTLAQAAVIFSDNFDSENGGTGQLNYTGFSNWSVAPGGSVDLIGNTGPTSATALYDFLPGNGLYVDMDGSTGSAGTLTHYQQLGIGNYTLSFDLAGNQRNAANELTGIDINVLFNQGIGATKLISLPMNAGFTNYSMNFSVTDPLFGNFAGVRFTFQGAGGDNIGMLLDNVMLQDQAPANVPEPSTLGLLGVGLLGMGILRRKQRS